MSNEHLIGKLVEVAYIKGNNDFYKEHYIDIHEQMNKFKKQVEELNTILYWENNFNKGRAELQSVHDSFKGDVSDQFFIKSMTNNVNDKIKTKINECK